MLGYVFPFLVLVDRPSFSVVIVELVQRLVCRLLE